MSQIHVAHVNRCHAFSPAFLKGSHSPPGRPALLHASACHLVYCSFLTFGFWRALCTRTVAAVLIASPVLSAVDCLLFLSLFPLSSLLTRSHLPHAHARSMPGHRRVKYVPAHSYSHLTILCPVAISRTFPPIPALTAQRTHTPAFSFLLSLRISPVCHFPVPYLRSSRPSEPFIPGKSPLLLSQSRTGLTTYMASAKHI